MRKILILILLILSSCRPTCTNLNNELISEFNRNLEIIKALQNHKEVNVESYRNALFYIINTTNIMSRADYSETLGYRNKEDYNNDMKLWKEWLEKNKCN
jgi:hypothetical protein